MYILLFPLIFCDSVSKLLCGELFLLEILWQIKSAIASVAFQNFSFGSSCASVVGF